jgi:hypothetical protein
MMDDIYGGEESPREDNDAYADGLLNGGASEDDLDAE